MLLPLRPQSLCLHQRPTYLHLLPGSIRSSCPAPPPLVLCPLCKLIPPARPPSLPASLRPSPFTSSSGEPWPTPAQLSPNQTAPRGPIQFCLSLLLMSSPSSGGSHGTLSLSPSNPSGCQKTMTSTWRRSCGSFDLRGLSGLLASLRWSPAAGWVWSEITE